MENLDDPNKDKLESLRTELYSLNLTKSFGAQIVVAKNLPRTLKFQIAISLKLKRQLSIPGLSSPSLHGTKTGRKLRNQTPRG